MISNKNNKKDNLELTAEVKQRTMNLQVIIDNFEEVALKYGPASSDELKTRINKIIRNFDSELKKILELKFEIFWNSQEATTFSLDSKNEVLNSDIPKFLKNYKK